MSSITPVRTVIIGCGMIAAGGYQPRCQAYPNQIELVGFYDQDKARADEPSPPKAFKGLDWGKGVADFADAIRHDRNPRCNGAQARHVLEVCQLPKPKDLCL